MLIRRSEKEAWAIVDNDGGLMYCGDWCKPKPMVYSTESTAKAVLTYFKKYDKKEFENRNPRIVKIHG